VLDTNVWLATHVVMVTLGYSATFLAGFLGVIYIFRGLLTTSFDETTAKSLGRMMYGVVCFATLFSLVGTILGGIWADQSWGRFWGWDPKENGALLIVLWNAIILHTRWGGYARERTIAVMTVFGNIITSLSWFGVNMLGIGLHSYGFMDQAFAVLLAFIISQLAIMGAGMVPQKYWRGVQAREKANGLEHPDAALVGSAGVKQ
jgi:ABC-type transport system involved in cytochrome c biogenesis permease subunit